MTPLHLKIIECLVVLLIYVLLKAFAYKIIDKTLKEKVLHSSRGFIIKKAINITLILMVVLILFFIWGVRQSDLVFFIGSVLTVTGVALFAQWSLLSNMTSSLIIFFNHPIKINDHISILEGKDYVLSGQITHQLPAPAEATELTTASPGQRYGFFL